eukprot:6198335-Prymnesium_polylepis.1
MPAPRAAVPRHAASVLECNSTLAPPPSWVDAMASTSAKTVVITSVTAWTTLECEYPDVIPSAWS